MRAEVVGVDLEARTVSMTVADGTQRTLDSAYLDDGWLDHAYALTAHGAQGATVSRSFVLGSDEMYREVGYTALSRHRDQAHFYIVSPGSVERALPGLEPEGDPLNDDIVEMLSPSHRKDMATEVLERTGPENTQRVWQQAQEQVERAQQRIEALESERDQIRRIHRSQRAALDEQIAHQRASIARWMERASSIDATEIERPDPRPRVPLSAVDLNRARAALVDPASRLTATIGERPDSLAARETWSRAAAQLVSTEPATIEPVTEPAAMDDLGLEL
jgi:hypothetical protein